MITVLLGRTAQLQAGDSARYEQAAASNSTRTIVESATRGLILDQAGRPLAANRQTMQIVVDRSELYDLPEDGSEVVDRVADVLGTTFAAIDARLTFCGSAAAVVGVCWDGAAAEPIPIATDVTLEQALPILEQPDQYPGISVRMSTIRSYPSTAGERAGHLLGHLGAVTAEELAGSAAGFEADDVVGRGGVEEEYDAALRGTNGSRTVAVDTVGRVTQTLQQVPAVHGSTVVTSIDAALQAVVEEQLAAAVQRARAGSAEALAADSGAAVVVDVTNGRVLAMASYPDFSPSLWSGGVSEADYRGLLETGALLFTPVQGTYAPGSTFKPFTVAAMAAQGYDVNGSYSCPSSYSIGPQRFTNYESHSYGQISLRRALEVSCNTVFYRAGKEIYDRTGGAKAGPAGADPIATAAAEFGLGRATGVDLPGEAVGQVSGRQVKDDRWLAKRDAWCAAAAEGYPQLRQTDPDLADEYTALDAENCASGGTWLPGDAVNAAIGQGLTAVTPLQLAMAYAAIANGGTVFQPQVATAVVGPDGDVTRIQPHPASTAAVDGGTLRFLSSALQGVTRQGTAAAAFTGFPLDEVPVAGKTGSAQVSGGKSSTAWFASYAPADNPRYAVIMMVAQGGTGGQTAAPSVRAIYDAIFGVVGGRADPARSIFEGGKPLDALPRLDGVVPSEARRGDRP